MDPIMELKSIQARLATLDLEAKAANRDLTPAEVDEVTASAQRAAELKGVIDRAKRVTEASKGNGTTYTTETRPNGTEHTYSESPKGFLTPESLKSTARTMAVTAGTKALVAGGSTVTPVSLDTKPIPLGQSGLGLLSFLPVRQRDSAKYSYIAQTARTNNTAVVAAGAVKPTSVYTVASVDGELKVYASLSEPIDKYLLRDNSDLQDFLDAELRNGLVRKLTADAVAAIAAKSGIQTQSFVNSAADSIYLGMSKVTSLGFSNSVLVLPLEDYDAIRLSKNDQGDYIGGNPFDGSPRVGLWGVPTLASPDLASGTALVLGEGAVGLSTDKVGIETEWNPYSYFDKNQVVARNEARFAVDIFQPQAVVKVTTKSA